jgi:phenylglyoxylate dehydrogenase epsilon subunit
MDDAVVLNAAIREAQTAVVLGAGLVGMHAAENLARAGAKVTVVERLPQVLPGYFDARAARIIETAFARNGATMRLGRTVTAVAPADGASLVTLDDGERIAAGMILVATGVRPAIDYLAGSGIAVDRGVLVDDAMRTSAEDVWAAGDVAQARDFFGTGGKIGGILPDAVEQGRIAGMSMAGDPAARGWQGGVPLNTYHFFGDHAVSVGLADVPAGDHVTEVDEVYEPATPYFRKIILRDGRLVGISAINAPLDPGIMWQLILRKVDLRPVMADFVRRPLETGRILMSQMWR